MKSIPTTEYTALQICHDLRQLLSSLQSGTVHSVFASSVNLLAEGKLITLLTEHRPLYPFSVRLAADALPALAAGTPCTLSESEIAFPEVGAVIRLQNAKETDLSLYGIRDTLTAPAADMAPALREAIIAHGKTDGFAPLLGLLEDEAVPFSSNPYADFAAKRIPALFQAVQKADPAKAAEAAYGIAGCGVGLTPSADDFLCGFIAALLANALTAGNIEQAQTLAAAMAAKAAERTNLISGTFLKEAAMGLFSEDVLILIQTLYSSVLSQKLLPSVMNVIAFGETSGTDILTGIYFGQKIHPNLGGNGIG